jgi:hypothetical protein
VLIREVNAVSSEIATEISSQKRNKKSACEDLSVIRRLHSCVVLKSV